jgi:hypothetical protein
MQHVPSKRQQTSTKLHGNTRQNTLSKLHIHLITLHHRANNFGGESSVSYATLVGMSVEREL